MGALIRSPRPEEMTWAAGILEVTSNGFGGLRTRPRLVLRDSRSNPDKGLIFELYRPVIVNIEDKYIRVQGIEPMPLARDEVSAMVQEWLILHL